MGSWLQTIENNLLKQKRHFGKSFRYQIAWIHQLQKPASLGPQGGKAQLTWTHTVVHTLPPHQPATAPASSPTNGPPSPLWAPPLSDAADVLWHQSCQENCPDPAPRHQCLHMWNSRLGIDSSHMHMTKFPEVGKATTWTAGPQKSQ